MDRKIPLRECIGCRQLKPKKDMLRVIKTQENTVEIDVTGKKNGRGAYVCYSETCLETAYKKKGLERSLKMPIPEEIYLRLQKELMDFESK